MIEKDIEGIILSSLIHDEVYYANVIPYLKSEYFEELPERYIFTAIKNFGEKYKKPPTIESLFLDLEDTDNIQESTWSDIQELLEIYKTPSDVDSKWRMDESESWCKNRAFFIAFNKGVEILDSNDEKSKGEIPNLLSQALAVSFDNHIGIEYGRNPEEQWDYYNHPDSTLPFDLDIFNKVTKGGLRRKTLFMLMSSKTGGFKSGTMCHMAASYQSAGYNALYITCELAENEVIKRIDANLCDIPLDDLHKLPKATYVNRVKTIKKGTTGRCIVKEYATGTAHSGHFRYLLKELESKNNFKPDVVFIDYLNICASSRQGVAGNNSYTIIKSIAEEIRALSFEFDCAIVSATQSGRQGVKAGKNIDVDDISESYGLAATADVIFAIIDDEELSNENKLLYKQIKNRYGDINNMGVFGIGVEKAKMRLHDIETLNNNEHFVDEDKPAEMEWRKKTKIKNIDDWVM
ncbi:MAG: DNA primase [Gammaproteobacteria bacterium]|nr:DNA primase [Gammaproteobacteria bacterium]